MKTYRTAQGDMWDSIAFVQLGSEAYTDANSKLEGTLSSSCWGWESMG